MRVRPHPCIYVMTTFHISKTVSNSTIVKVYKGQDSLDVLIPEFVILKSNGFTTEEQLDAILKMAKERDKILFLGSQKACSINI